MEQEFGEFSKFSESNKSLKHELDVFQRSCVSHVPCWHCDSILIINT